jgi:hypothetical protein
MAVSPGSAPAIPDVDGGVVLGTVPGGGPVRVPFFTAARGTRCAVIGDRSIAALMAKRALDAGARVQVVTSEPDDWFRLRGHAGLSPERLAVADPGTAPPPDGTGSSPWMIMDDTGILTGDPDGAGARIPRASNPWQTFCAVSSARNVAVAALRGMDAIVLFRSSPFCRAVAAVALQLPDSAMRSLHGIPSDVVAVASAGTVRLAPIRCDAAECALFAELGLPIWPSQDCWPRPALTPAGSFAPSGTGLKEQVA